MACETACNWYFAPRQQKAPGTQRRSGGFLLDMFKSSLYIIVTVERDKT